MPVAWASEADGSRVSVRLAGTESFAKSVYQMIVVLMGTAINQESAFVPGLILSGNSVKLVSRNNELSLALIHYSDH